MTANAVGAGCWRVFTDPAYIARSRLRRAVEALVGRLVFDGRGTWLDLGCGSRPYETLFDVECYFGLDVVTSGHPEAGKRPDLFFDGDHLPIRAGSVDGVLCTQVLEHTADPVGLLNEAWRVLKPGGLLIMTVPFVWEEHEQPYDFFRFTEPGLRHLLAQCGFAVDVLEKTSGTLETLAQISSIYVFDNLRVPVRGFGRLLAALVCAPIQICGLLAQRVLPDRRNLYLDHALLARKDAREIVS